MLKLFLFNRWSVSLIAMLVGMLLYSLGLHTASMVVIPVLLAFTMARGVTSLSASLTSAFLAGAMVGIAALSWWYALIAVLFLIIYVYMVMKINDVKVFYTIIVGMLTPLWIALPFAFFRNMDRMEELLNSAIVLLKNAA